MHRGGPFDPDRGEFLFISGRKGSGKSVAAGRFFDAFPYDRLIIDPTGDVSAGLTERGVQYARLTEPMPVHFPRSAESDQVPVTAVYVPDMGSPDAEDEMDRALGLGLRNQRTCVWIDEIGTLTRNGKTPPNLRRALHHGRHSQLTLVMCGPRPKDIDPLCVSQADHVFTFDTPNPMDRKRIAENIGWPPAMFDQAVADLGEHEYLWYNARAHTLTQMPKFPPRRRAYAVGPMTQPTF
ncbi:MAG: hypothetical protein ACRDVE_18110 [Actinocrinis sp.]